jgi:sugar lactone lactonase YvrE
MRGRRELRTKLELALDAMADLGEGALWYGPKQVLYWVDINVGDVHAFNPATGDDICHQIGQDVGTVVPRKPDPARPYESVMLALRTGFAALNLENGKTFIIADPERHIPANRFNDGKCDPAGRFWAGTMPDGAGAAPDGGSLYCLYADHHVEVKERGIRCSNGLAWSLDNKTMYYIDTPAMEIWAYDYDLATGETRNRRTVVSVPEEDGYPDGMTADAEGNLWVAHWGGWQVVCWNPLTGAKLSSIPIPAAQVTSCAFGGKDLDELYITTARTGIARQDLRTQPHAGSIFVIRPGMCGIPSCEFAG